MNLDELSSYTLLCISFVNAFVAIVGGGLTLFFIYRKSSEFYYKSQQKVLYDTLP